MERKGYYQISPIIYTTYFPSFPEIAQLELEIRTIGKPYRDESTPTF